MDGICTILFEDPFWVAIFEISDEDGYRAARHVFGSLPNEAELHVFALEGFEKLIFTTPQEGEWIHLESSHYKRRQREARRQLSESPKTKKAWEAIKSEHEAQKKDKTQASRDEKEAAEREVYLARLEKKKEKKRGR